MKDNFYKGVTSALVILSLAFPLTAMAKENPKGTQNEAITTPPVSTGPESCIDPDEAVYIDEMDPGSYIYIDEPESIDSMIGISDEEKAALKSAFEELEKLEEELCSLWDDDGNVTGGKEARAAEIEERTNKLYEVIDEIYDKELTAYIDSMAGVTDEEKAALKSVFEELGKLEEELYSLWDDDGNVTGGKETRAAEIEERISKLNEVIDKIYGKGLTAYIDSMTGAADEEKAALKSAFEELGKLEEELYSLWDDDGNVTGGNEARVAEMDSQIDKICNKISAIWDIPEAEA